MLSTVFNGTDKLGQFLNEKEKNDFVRQYTSLIDRLSDVEFQQQQQWNYYHHIGMTKNIWMNRISKKLAEKNSIFYTYGRSKTRTKQRRKTIRVQLQQAQHGVQLFEQQTLLKAAKHIDCSSEMKVLSSIINTFVHAHQQKLHDEFEYKRQMLTLDATDHHLVQAFFDLKSNKTHITSARRIRQAAVKETMIDEEVALLEHRLTSKQSRAASTLLDHMINYIDTILTKPEDAIEQTVSTTSSSFYQFEKMNQLKHDIIHSSLITRHKMVQNFVKIIRDEKQRYSFHKNHDESPSEIQVLLINAIETRRLHMIQRAKYITQQKLATYFKQN